MHALCTNSLVKCTSAAQFILTTRHESQVATVLIMLRCVQVALQKHMCAARRAAPVAAENPAAPAATTAAPSGPADAVMAPAADAAAAATPAPSPWSLVLSSTGSSTRNGTVTRSCSSRMPSVAEPDLRHGGGVNAECGGRYVLVQCLPHIVTCGSTGACAAAPIDGIDGDTSLGTCHAGAVVMASKLTRRLRMEGTYCMLCLRLQSTRVRQVACGLPGPQIGREHVTDVQPLS